jgi:hypothetical protein
MKGALLAVLIVLLITTGCTCGAPKGNQSPTAYIDSAMPAETTVGTKIAFKGHGTDPDGTVVAYRWRSNIDGDLSAEPNFETTSLTAGDHTIYLKVQDNNGAWSEEACCSIIVSGEVVVPPVVNSFQFLAEYYNYTPQSEPVFSGDPVFSQCEDSINYDWTTGGPGHGIGNDWFLARWTGTFSFEGGDYTFTAKVDDGVRLWVDGSLIIDEWRPQATTEFSVTRELLPAKHQVKVEYFERMGAAVCQVRWDKYSPGGIIFERAGEIWVMKPDGTNQTRVTKVLEASEGFPAWSKDGSRIAFDSYPGGNWEIYTMNADGSNKTRLTNDPALDRCPAWSPDGTKIAFHSNRDGNYEIYVMNADGSNQTRLTNNNNDDGFPAWSPDGTRIAFQSIRDGNYEIYVMNTNGTSQTRLTNNLTVDLHPAWSPDGTKIAFDSNSQIDVMNADGTNPTHLTAGISPAWSPDGTRIVFQSYRDGNSEIYVMNANGTNQVRLTNNSIADNTPDWR